MNSTEPMPELVPTPSALVALVKQLVACVWPKSEEEREAFFRELGFASGAEFERGQCDSNTKSYALSTILPGDIFATWCSFNGDFMGINLQPYSVMEPESPTARRGHDEIQGQLTALYGEPIRPWDDEEIQPTIWEANARVIVMHFFHLRDSGVMLSIDDSELAAAAEAEAIARSQNEPPRL